MYRWPGKSGDAANPIGTPSRNVVLSKGVLNSALPIWVVQAACTGVLKLRASSVERVTKKSVVAWWVVPTLLQAMYTEPSGLTTSIGKAFRLWSTLGLPTVWAGTKVKPQSREVASRTSTALPALFPRSHTA